MVSRARQVRRRSGTWPGASTLSRTAAPMMVKAAPRGAVGPSGRARGDRGEPGPHAGVANGGAHGVAARRAFEVGVRAPHVRRRREEDAGKEERAARPRLTRAIQFPHHSPTRAAAMAKSAAIASAAGVMGSVWSLQ